MKKSDNDLEAVRRDIAESGAMAVYRSLLEICGDREAAVQARVAAGSSIMRMSGLFDDAKRRPADESDDASEMTPEQLRRALPSLEKELQRIQAGIAERKARLAAPVFDDEFEMADDVFG